MSEVLDRIRTVTNDAVELVSRQTAAVTLVTLAAFTVRIHGVGTPPLLDGEAIVGITGKSIAETGQNMLPAGHPYFRGESLTHVVGVSFWLFGDTTTSLRVPTVVAGTAAVPVVYLIGRRMVSSSVGLTAATLLAFTSVNVAWARTARFYAVLQLCILVALYSSVRVDQLLDVDFETWAVTAQRRRLVTTHVVVLAVTTWFAYFLHRGWLFIPLLVGSYWLLPALEAEPDRLVWAKLVILTFVSVNVLLIITTGRHLVPPIVFQTLGLPDLSTTSIWRHPITNSTTVSFYSLYLPVVSVLAIVGTLSALWRRGTYESLVLVGFYVPLFLLSYFGSSFRFIWRPRYLLLTLPFFTLLAALGVRVVMGWLLSRAPDFDDGDTIDVVRVLSNRRVCAVALTLLLIATPVGSGVAIQPDPYDRSLIEEPRPNYARACEELDGRVHEGDVVITNRPNQLYFWVEKVDYRGNTYSSEFTFKPGYGHYTAAPFIYNASQMQEIISSNDRVWVVYNPFLNLKGRAWVERNLQRVAVAESPFDTPFPQGLYQNRVEEFQETETVYVYAKGIETNEPEGPPVETNC